MIRAGVPWSWGATADERSAAYPCAALVPGPAFRMIRATDVSAPADVTFRWVCQLRVAPYSYDVVDNLGRRSPRTLTRGADELAVGARFLMIFRVAAWVDGREVTAAGPGRSCTYRVTPAGTGSRLVARLDVAGSSRLLGAALAWGDLVMMRKQLRTLAALAGG